MKKIIFILLILLVGCSNELFTANKYCRSIGYENAEWIDSWGTSDMSFYCVRTEKTGTISNVGYHELKTCFLSDCCEMNQVNISYIVKGCN